MISGMILAMMVIFGYQIFVSWLWKHNNWKVPGSEVSSTQQISPTTEPTETTSVASAASTPTTGAATQTAAANVVGSPTTQPAMIGSLATKDPTYAMGVGLVSQGASIDSVALNQFKLKVGDPEPYSYEKPDDFGPQDRALASRSIVIDGQTYDLASVDWALEKSAPGEATYSVEIQNAGQKVARVHKTYHLDTIPDSKSTSNGYEITITFAVDNLTKSPIKVSQSFNGPLPPRPETSRGPDRNVIGGYDAGGYIELNHHAIEELKPENPQRDITKSEKDSKPIVWAGIGGTYFDSILRPLPIGQTAGAASYIANVQAESIHNDAQHEHPEVRTTFTTADQSIDPGATFAFQLKLFQGPKQRSLLENDYYSAPLIAYRDTLVMTTGICGFCAIDWLINTLVWLLSFFHMILHDWGLAIIGLVVLVRLILHPITKKSQVNMMKMSKMGPEMERLKKKYGDDKEAIAKAQMELYKEMGFTPVLGCLPMFLQMPIFISLWQALQSTFELRHAPFLYGFTWIKDLSQADQLIAFGHPIPLYIFGWHLSAINLLPVLVAIVSFLNMKYTPRPPAATPEAEQQQKMMQWMTLVFPLMFYSFPSGLNIYYLTSTTLGIWEGKRIRAHIKEREEAEKGDKIIVDASPKSRRKPTKENKPPEKAKGRFATWLARIQEQAEQMRVETEKRNKGRS
jgi:YidC/Oxa1 family membrane protein insertase